MPPFLEALATELARQPFRAEILIVDDGSRTSERERLLRAVRLLRERFASILEPLLLAKNLGKGAAILAGWRHRSSLPWLAFVDADGAIAPSEVSRIFALISAREAAATCIFASRVKMLGRTVERSGSRHLVGRIFATMVGRLIDPRVYDSQCGFKVISNRAFTAIEPHLAETGFAFDVELTCALLDSDFPIEEVPIDWSDVAGSKVSMLRDTWRMFFALLRIRDRRSRWRLSKQRS